MKITDTDQKKIKAQQEFVRRLQELMQEYPEQSLHGDRNGSVVVHTTIGQGFSTRSHTTYVDDMPTT